MSQNSWGPSPPSALPGTTLERHVFDRQRQSRGASGEFTALFHQIMLAAKIVNSRVRQAGLAGVLGLTGQTNVQGEQVQKLDEIANAVLIRACEAGGQLCLMASEENDEPIPIPIGYPQGKYVLMFDPLDGSSNIDVNVSIGTIFSIHRRVTERGPGTLADCLQVGSKQVAAGYILYGSSTMLVYTTGDGVHGFTFDPAAGEFFLSHENIRIPKRGNLYSINEGNASRWSEGVRNWVAYLKTPDAATGRPYGSRYVGSMVADVHRTLLKGGVFAYPGDAKTPDGKLRLLYEAAPLAFVIEAAGGRGSTGTQRLLDLQPSELHQRAPVLLGSIDDVEVAEAFWSGRRSS